MDKKFSKVACSSLIRVMKNHDYYDEFVGQINKQSKLNHSDNPLTNFKNIDELSERLYTITYKQFRSGNHFDDSEYGFITMCINNLLHYILEYTQINKRSFGMLGQETFDIACEHLFGDKYFEDMEKLNHGAPKPKNDEEAILISEFMTLKNKGHNISWEDFLRIRRKGVSSDIMNDSIDSIYYTIQ